MNSPFSDTYKNLQIAWDSTSLGWLEECPRKYYYQMILGLSSKRPKTALVWGILFHKCMEIYNQELSSHGDREQALEHTVRWALQAGEMLSFSTERERNRFTLVRALIWYDDQYGEDPAKTVTLQNGKAAVELSFRLAFPLTSPDGQQYILCGHLDRIVEFAGSLRFLDYKTTKYQLDDRFYSKFRPNHQFSIYSFASKIVLKEEAIGGIADGIQCAVNFNRFHRRPVHRTEAELSDWVQSVSYWLRHAEEYAKNSYWPMNEKACDLYGGCVFRGVCGKDPQMRQAHLDANFESSVWNPLDSREA